MKIAGNFIPDIDRLKTALDHKEADCVPNWEVGIDKGVVEAIIGEPLKEGLAGELQYRTQFGYDFLYVVPRHETPPVYTRRSAEQGQAVTAEGDRRGWVDQHSHMITDWKSLQEYEYPAPGSLVLDEVREAVRIARTLPGNVGVGALMPSAPFMEVNMLMGYEDFCMTLYEDYDLCKALVDRIGKTGVEDMKQLCREDIDFVLFGDDMAYTGGMMISPVMMRDLFFPWYRKFIAAARDAGKYVFFHSDGNIEPVIGDFIDAGLQALNPIEPLAMDIVRLKAEYGDKLALAGNIDVDLLARGTPDQVDAQVKERIEALAPGGGFLLASSNSIADYVKPENYVAMLNACRKYGKY